MLFCTAFKFVPLKSDGVQCVFKITQYFPIYLFSSYISDPRSGIVVFPGVYPLKCSFSEGLFGVNSLGFSLSENVYFFSVFESSFLWFYYFLLALCKNYCTILQFSSLLLERQLSFCLFFCRWLVSGCFLKCSLHDSCYPYIYIFQLVFENS